MNKVTILGSGTSTGVPILGCNCQVCQSNDPRNKRFRTSILLQTAKLKSILVDTSPDLRTQLLNAKVKHIDAAIITHDHADHTHGIDDLRPYTFIQNTSIPIYTNELTTKDLMRKFPYIFDREKVYGDRPILGGGIPKLHLETVTGKCVIENEEFELIPVPHGHQESTGIIHKKLAYFVDCREIPRPVIDQLKATKLEILILDCLRYQPHQTHLHLDKSLEYIHEIAPRTTILTHMGHEMEYLDLIHQLERRGIKNVFPAIDGQSFLYS